VLPLVRVLAVASQAAVGAAEAAGVGAAEGFPAEAAVSAGAVLEGVGEL